MLLKAYIVAGRPQQDIAPYGSFTQWSDLIRSALVWIDAADPNLGRQDIEAQSDQAYEDLHVLFQAWKACYPVGEKRTLKEIFRDIEIYGSSSDEAAKAPWLALQEALRPYDQTRSDGTLSARSVGKNLPGGPSGSRIIHDLRLVSEDSAHDKVKRWSLVRASKG
jgi:putative DNA primase/helicase